MSVIEIERSSATAEEWLYSACEGRIVSVPKDTDETRAWFAELDANELFAKLYPLERTDTWAVAERSIAGGRLHPAIVPLRKVVPCADGDLHLYPRVGGENLGDSATRERFARLSAEERATAVLTVCEALAAVPEAGFTVVDWHEANTLYDFAEKRVWLFDWELCVPGPSFVLEMDRNYGSSRLMAPEEFVRGSTIDETTLVFNLGRFALLLIPDLAEPLAPILAEATYPAPSGRFPTVRAFGIYLRMAIQAQLSARDGIP